MKTILLTFMMVFGIAIVQSGAQTASVKACQPESCIKKGCTPEECAKLGMDVEKCKAMCAAACKPAVGNSTKCGSGESKMSSLIFPTLKTSPEQKSTAVAKVESTVVIE